MFSGCKLATSVLDICRHTVDPVPCRCPSRTPAKQPAARQAREPSAEDAAGAPCCLRRLLSAAQSVGCEQHRQDALGLCDGGAAAACFQHIVANEIALTQLEAGQQVPCNIRWL